MAHILKFVNDQIVKHFPVFQQGVSEVLRADYIIACVVIDSVVHSGGKFGIMHVVLLDYSVSKMMPETAHKVAKSEVLQRLPKQPVAEDAVIAEQGNPVAGGRALARQFQRKHRFARAGTTAE